MTTVQLTRLAGLLADPARAEMLMALMDDRPRSASELAAAANVTPSTASHHLGALLRGGLVKVSREGRVRYHRLAGYRVAELIELMTSFGPPSRAEPAKEKLAYCRTCYDHLAGQLGVALRLSLEANHFIEPEGDRYRVTASGERFFVDFGVDVGLLRKRKRALTRACLDWTERVPHLGGSLGAAILGRMLEQGWLKRGDCPRQLIVTPAGEARLGVIVGG